MNLPRDSSVIRFAGYVGFASLILTLLLAILLSLLSFPLEAIFNATQSDFFMNAYVALMKDAFTVRLAESLIYEIILLVLSLFLIRAANKIKENSKPLKWRLIALTIGLALLLDLGLKAMLANTVGILAIAGVCIGFYKDKK